MKYLESKIEFLVIVLVLSLLLLGLNSFYIILKEALGYGFSTFLFDTGDRFADIVKTALSYKNIKFINPNISQFIDSLDPLYQLYYYNNPYGGLANINNLTHFHLMPISTLLHIIACLFISYGIKPIFVMFFLFCMCLSLLFISSYRIFLSNQKSLLIVLLTIISYPLIFIITRGNYAAFFCGIGIIALLHDLFTNKKISIITLILFSIAINFRPNAVILLIAIPFVIGLRKSFSQIIYIGILSLSIYIITYAIVNFIYPDYNFNTFIKALSVYNRLYIIGNAGTAFNSSLYGAIKVIGLAVGVSISSIKYLFYLSSALLLLILYSFKKKGVDTKYYPFVFSSVYILINPVAADYHLIVFVSVIMLIYNDYQSWLNDRNLNFIVLATVMLLSPKNYFYIQGISLQVVLNPLIMILTIIYILRNAKSIP